MGLWQQSGAWRWLVCGSLTAVALAVIGGPWRSASQAQGPQPYASFDPAALRAATTPPAPTAAQSPAAAALSAPTATPPPMPPGMALRTGGANPGLDTLDDRRVAATQPSVSSAGLASAGGKPVAQAHSSVVWTVSHEGAAGHSAEARAISGGGLVATYCCAGASSTAWANRAVSSGRHYLELTLSVRPGAQTPGTWTAAGVTGRALSRPSAIMSRSGNTFAVPVGRDAQSRSGDVLMFAIDATEGLVYWGRNGEWRNGTPGQSGGTSVSSASEGLRPFVEIAASSDSATAEKDRWIANFGAAKFRYPIPPGFNSYGSDAALRGGSTAGPALPAATPATTSVESPIGRIHRDLITVGGRGVPLPGGAWTTLARFNGSPGDPGETVVLGQIDGPRMHRMIALRAHGGGATPSGAAAPAFASCQRNDLLFKQVDANEPGGPQRCWWINHATGVWTQQAIFKAARIELSQRNVLPADVWINVGFRRLDAGGGYVTAFHYFDPEEGGIASVGGAWADSEWHVSRIASDSRRPAYVEQRKAWAQDWAPIFFATR